MSKSPANAKYRDERTSNSAAQRWRLFALGSNSSGQLGVRHKEDVSQPQECMFDWSDPDEAMVNDDIVKIVAGGNHSIILLRSGAVFATGDNGSGQCGLRSNVVETSEFTQIELRDRDDDDVVQKFSDIAASWEASYFVDRRGRIWVSGAGAKGELGLGKNVTQCLLGDYKLGLPDTGAPSNFRLIRAGMGHVVMVTNEGKAYGWGASRKGQFGPDKQSEKILWRPTQLSPPFSPVDVYLGRYFTLMIGATFETQLWGAGPALEAREFQQPRQVATTWSNIYLRSAHNLEGFGRNDRGQLPPLDLPSLKNFAAGSEHCMAVTSEDEVIAWGWGEHGNCGSPINDRGNVAARWNNISVPLRPDEYIQGIAAGCATSFIVVKS